MRTGWWDVTAAGLLVFSVAVVFWPGIHGFWGRDDFAQLAMVRLVHTPWSFFLHDCYPVPGTEYRPLGYFSMWLGQAFFGSDYAAHARLDLALHAATSVALYGLIRRAGASVIVSLTCAGLFALHPAVIGTALWWSARFDLLATLFILLALHGALSYRRRPGAVALACMLVAMFLAMLCKETGLIAAAAGMLTALLSARRGTMERGAALKMLIASACCGVVFMLLRWVILGTFGSGMTAMVPVSQAVVSGLRDWPVQAFGYITFWPRLNGLQHGILYAFACIVVAGAGLAIRFRRGHRPRSRPSDLTLWGLCLFLFPVLLQAPIAAFATQASAHSSAVETAMQSRLYYLGLAGISMLFATWLPAARQRRADKSALVCILPVVLAFAWASRTQAEGFATRSWQIAGPARSAVNRVEAMDLPRSDCRVMFSGVPTPPEWGIYVSMDSVIKALAPDLDKIGRCWFYDDYTTSIHLQAAPATPADAAPYEPLRINGKPVPWRTIGNLTLAYVVAPPSLSQTQRKQIRFLRYENGGYVDISAEVAAGRTVVRLR